jgi:hypothetical protein
MTAEQLHKWEAKSEALGRANFFAAQALNIAMTSSDAIFPDALILGATHQVPAFAEYPELLLWDPTGRITGTKGDANGLVIVQPIPALVFTDKTGIALPEVEDDRNVFICRLAKQVNGGTDDALQVVERLCAERPSIKSIWIEEVASQAAIAPWLIERKKVKGVDVRGQKVGTASQASRLQGLATAMRQRQFILPDDFEGRGLLVRQLAEYPASDYDDVPCAASLLSQHRERRGVLPGLPTVEYNRHDPTGLWPEQVNQPPNFKGGLGW